MSERGAGYRTEHGRPLPGAWMGLTSQWKSLLCPPPRCPRPRAQTENRALLRAALLALQTAPRERPLEIRTTAEYLPRTVYGGPLARWRQSKWTAPGPGGARPPGGACSGGTALGLA